MASSSRHILRHGILLMDVAIAIVVVGVGIVAVMGMMVTATSSNTSLSDTYQATSIANAALEWGSNPTNLNATNRSTLFQGSPLSYTPTVLLDANGLGLTRDLPASSSQTYSGWTEVLTLRRVSETQLTANDASGTSSMWEMTVTVKKNGKSIISLMRLYCL